MAKEKTENTTPNSENLGEFNSEQSTEPADFTPGKNTLSDSDTYKLILDIRKFEIENFGKRTLFFWGTIGILFVGYFSSKNEQARYLICLSYLGFFYNLIFSISLRGSKYWQEHWEFMSAEFADLVKTKMFKQKVMKDIREHNIDNGTFLLLRTERFSVSKLTFILSDLTILFWFGLVIKDLHLLYNLKLIYLSIDFSKSIHYFTLFVVLFPLISLTYIIYFFVSEIRKNNSEIKRH